MSDTTRKPLPPALKALQPVLDTLSLEGDSEGETEIADIKDFTVSVAVGEFQKLTLGLMFGQLEAKVFYPKGEVQRELYRTKDGKVRELLPHDAISLLSANQRVCRRYPPHHWRVYDLTQQIPVGRVTTYKVICNTLGEGSPRSGMLPRPQMFLCSPSTGILSRHRSRKQPLRSVHPVPQNHRLESNDRRVLWRKA
jgi:hypothetical protein